MVLDFSIFLKHKLVSFYNVQILLILKDCSFEACTLPLHLQTAPTPLHLMLPCLQCLGQDTKRVGSAMNLLLEVVVY